jgi:glycosyltransferase involved in cell wall biosynthesis
MVQRMTAAAPGRILWVTHEVPDRNLGGGNIRQYHLLRALANRAEVDLVVVGRLLDDGLRAGLHMVTEIDRPAIRSKWRRRAGNLYALLPWAPPSEIEMDTPVLKALKPYLKDVGHYRFVHIEHEGLARLLPGRRTSDWGITLQFLMSVWSGQRAALSTKRRLRWLHETDVRHARRLERWIVDNYDLTITVSEEDSLLLGGRPVVVPNGVDLADFANSPLPRQPRLIFTGSFNWLPNIDGAQWLCREVFPRVRSEIPSATLQLVGREPDRRVVELSEIAGVETHFDVPAIGPFLEAARVALVPLRMGSGTRLKALEAMAARRPLAGTSVGLEGLGLVDSESAAIADTPEALAAAIVRLCQDDDFATLISLNARNLAESRFNWEKIADSYADLVLSTTLLRP